MMDNLTSLSPSSANVEKPEKDRREAVKFFINDKEYHVHAHKFDPKTSLNHYIRNVAHLKGTKNMCLEGGCGACVVTVCYPDPVTQVETIIAVNSCLVLIYSCDGWKIYTADGLGNPEKGYHPIQNAMVKFNGTQCGFCTSGMMMIMYALYESKDNLTMQEVENSFGGNICRCTGYRPILTAFKSLADDATPEIIGTYSDIEDIPVCKKRNCRATCEKPCGQNSAHFLHHDNFRWYKAYEIKEVLEIIKTHTDKAYMLVGGNTASGVFKDLPPVDVYIDITSVKGLLGSSIVNKNLVLGANMTLTNTMNLFNKLAGEQVQFAYLKKLAEHIDLVAHVAVRNIATLGGNLMMKHMRNQFSSDIFVILETVGASVTIIDTAGKEVSKSLLTFLKHDMKSSIIKNIILPPLDETYKFESYKIMPVAQNAHAIVNAGFLFQFDKKNYVKTARIVYGGINPEFVHAVTSEKYLQDINIFNNATLQGVLKILYKELVPNINLPDASPKYRKDLATALLYKFILSIAPDDKVSPRNKSGGKKQKREISKGTQDFGTDESLYPLTEPVNKLESLAQSTGKAEYFMDMPDSPDQLFAAFVLAKAPANSIITAIDTSKALSLHGVKAYFDKNDIPGENTFTPAKTGLFIVKDEEVFCNGTVKYYYQPIGIIVATTQALAIKAAILVEVTYTPPKDKPLLTIKDIIKNNATSKIISELQVEAKTKGEDVQHVVEGEFNIGWQYQYHMETQCCVAVPTDDGLNLYSSTQDMNTIQTAAAKLLKIGINKVNVVVRRLGGSYGGKLLRNGMISCAAALAAYKLQKPVKLFMPMEANMHVVGGRFPFYGKYEVGVNNEGVIQYLDASAFTDFGSNGGNENLCPLLLDTFLRCYKSDTFSVQVYSARTDNRTGSWCRGPATVEATAYIENIMQNIAVATNMDPITVRLNNITNEHVKKYTNELIEWANVRDREDNIKQFNKENRWVKKGLAVSPIIFPLALAGTFHVHVSVFQADGTVAITHGGIEMGQGINTKVAQVCAHILKIPLDIVTVQPSQSVVCPNDFTTGGSITSECLCMATLKACEILNERMKPIRETMEEPVDWAELVYKCFLANVDLCGTFMFYPTIEPLTSYEIYAVICVETELDVLTGLRQVRRVDILEDTGDSMSPNIDIGQIEGGFMMGLGYWTSEEHIFDEEGKLLTYRTWNYKPPGAKDIPEKFNIKLPKKNPNLVGVLNAKATAEPPTGLGIAVALAIKNAVEDARVDSDPTAIKWYPIDGPCTVENTFLNSLNDHEKYLL